MQYSELIKNFERVRETMRDFFVYGFRTRSEYTKKSSRSYDDERRRLESWLGDYMYFRQTPDGKNIFLTIDSRAVSHNPLYAAWKSKSFTDGDITLHFLLMDILDTPETILTLTEITEQIDEKLSLFPSARLYDESTVRKKLKEYTEEGIVKSEKRGRNMVYRRAVGDAPLPDPDFLDFFSEVSPCGVVGAFLLDKTGDHDNHFAFKHHYIAGAMDSGVMYELFRAMKGKRLVTLELYVRAREQTRVYEAVPLRILISVQSGRQYLMAYVPRYGRISSCRLDSIVSVNQGVLAEDYDMRREEFEQMRSHLWGVSTHGASRDALEHVEFTVRFEDNEQHIFTRLKREKRCGTVVGLDNHTARFSADVYDSSELVPWIRTFIRRITEIHFSNPELDRQFREDLNAMYRLYGLDENREEEAK